MSATECVTTLHTLSPKQLHAVEVLTSGGSHTAAAQAAGVNRVTITRWANHHPAFVAEMNRGHLAALEDHRANVERVTGKAMGVIEQAIDAGDVAAAFRWYQLNAQHPHRVVGATDSRQVVEAKRAAMPSALLADLMNDPNTEVAERVIAQRLELQT